ncbi:MAG: DUF423 domain-containing protein [Ignavibacteriales bacterium]|nr:DUF423 domain-containing protein [Ignavibacteriales bacterium]
MKSRTFFLLGSVGGFFSVALGAFGAHTLKPQITSEMLSAFETGVRYQMYHSLALFVVGYALGIYARRQFAVAGWLFVAGIVMFSGSLYAMAVMGMTWLGPVTPIGGVAFLAGWLVLAYGFWKVQSIT